MAQPNVAREPSMDEILASIRRIIENNEALTDFSDDARLHDSFSLSRDEDDLLDDPTIVEAFHVEETRTVADIQPLHRAAPAYEAPSPQPALSLADVAARVRAASERHVANRMQMPAEPEADEQEPESRPEPIAAFRPEPQAPAREIPVETVSVEPVAVAVEPAEVAAPLPDSASLVSPAVGERVAQSFGALAEALDAGPRRSFDDIAQDMLRPMLQEWLDDNLPTLVERLVREEIERVARGPRR